MPDRMADDDFANRVAPHRDAMLRLAARLVGPAAAEALAQDALRCAWRRRRTWAVGKEPADLAWLLGIVRERAPRHRPRADAVQRRRVGVLVAVVAVVTASVFVAPTAAPDLRRALVGAVAPADGGTTATRGDAAEIAGHPACGDSLRAGPARRSVYRGVTQLEVPLQLVGTQACTLRGFPEVIVVAAGSRIAAEVAHRPVGASLRGIEPVTLYPGIPGIVTLSWRQQGSCAPSDTAESGLDGLVILPPGATAPLRVADSGGSMCAGTGAAGLEVFPVRTDRTDFPENQLLRAGGR